MNRFMWVLLLTSCSLLMNSQDYQGLGHMTPDLWQQDIDYLNKKIQKEFASFNGGAKMEFEKNANVLKKETGSLDNLDAAIKVGQLVASLGDGHTEMSILQGRAGFDRLPVIFYYFDEGLYIIAAHDQYKDYIGARVIRFGSKTVSEVHEQLKSIMAYDNDYEILYAGTAFLQLPAVHSFLGTVKERNGVELLIEINSQEEKVDLPSLSINQYQEGSWLTYRDLHHIDPPFSAKFRDRSYWYEYLPGEKIMYFHFRRTNDQKGHPSIRKTVLKMFDLFDEVQPDKLVIDLRFNSGGNYNKSRPLIEEIKKRSELDQKGKIYALTGRMTFSAAMVTSIFLKQETQAILVGEPSRGHPNKCDNIEYMTLPNSNLRIEYTTKVKKHWAELGDLDHVPIDVDIRPSFEDFRNGRDRTLDFVLKQ